jgi:hypothetical protein
MSTRSGTVYAKSFAPFANKTKIHSTQPTLNDTPQKRAKQMPEYCSDIDYDSSSDYYEEVDENTPKYEVNIDFDEASIAWRANKRRVGESWVYKKPTRQTKKLVPASTLVTTNSSIASRVKEFHQSK